MDFALQVNSGGKMKESENVDKYLDLAGELKSQWNIRVMLLVSGELGTIPEALEKSGGIGNQRKNRNPPNYSIVKVGYSTQMEVPVM